MHRTIACLLLLLAACSGPAQQDDVTESLHPALARSLAWTHTHEIRFGEDSFVSGYLVEFLTMPAGLDDNRPYPAKTVLLQDTQLNDVGMITPGNRAYTFDDQGQIVDLGVSGRNDQVCTVFSRRERPRYTSLTPGTGR